MSGRRSSTFSGFSERCATNSFRRRAVAEWRPPREQLVRHASERIDVRAVVGVGVARRLFRRDVRRRADAGSCRRERIARRHARRRNGLRNAEVRDGGGAAGHEHVVRLDVAMHDALRVGVLEGTCHIAKNRIHVAQRQRAILRQPRPKRLSLDERHRVVRQAHSPHPPSAPGRRAGAGGAPPPGFRG